MVIMEADYRQDVVVEDPRDDPYPNDPMLSTILMAYISDVLPAAMQVLSCLPLVLCTGRRSTADIR